MAWNTVNEVGRRRRLVPVASLLLAVCLAGNALPVAAQNEVPTPAPETAELAKELERLHQQIRDRRRESFERRTLAQERIEELTSQKRALERGNRALQKELDKRASKLAGQEAKLKEHQDTAKELNETYAEFRQRLTQFCDNVKQRIESGIHWKLESRINGLGLVTDLLKDSATSPAMGISAIGRIQSEQEALGRLVEPANFEIKHNEELIQVSGFHLGLLAIAFANQDGNVIGFAQRGQTLEQGVEAVRNNPAAADGYLRAIDILERRRTPALVDLVLPFLPVAKKGGE